MSGKAQLRRQGCRCVNSKQQQQHLQLQGPTQLTCKYLLQSRVF